MEINYSELKLEQCQKADHFSKELEFICTLPNCKERFHCTVCVLKDHSHHFIYIQLIEHFIKEKAKELNRKKKKEKPSDYMMKEIKELIKDKEKKISEFIKAEKEEKKILKDEFKTIKKKMKEEIKKIEKIIAEKQQKSIIDLDKAFEGLKTYKNIYIEQKNNFVINSLDDYRDYLNKKYNTNTQTMKESPLKIISELYAIIEVSDDINIPFYEGFLSKLNLHFKTKKFETKKFAWYLMKTYTPTSNLDYKTLVNSKTLESFHKKSIYKILFICQEKYFFTCSDDALISLYQFPSGKLIKNFVGHSDRVWNMIRTDANKLISGSSDHKIIIWPLDNLEEELKNLNIDNNINEEKIVHTNNVDSKEETKVLETDNKVSNFINYEKILIGHTNFVCALMELPNNLLISGGHDKTLRVWDLNSYECIQTIKPAGLGRIMIIIMFNEDELIVGSENNISFINYTTGKVTATLKGHTHLIRDLLLLDDFNTLLSGSDDKTLRVWNIKKNECLKVFTGHQHSTNKIILFKKDIVCTASDDGMIKFWDISKLNNDNTKALKTLTGHSNWIIYATLISDGRLVSCGADKKIRFWSN
jgi:WD40 repeat protein